MNGRPLIFRPLIFPSSFISHRTRFIQIILNHPHRNRSEWITLRLQSRSAFGVSCICFIIFYCHITAKEVGLKKFMSPTLLNYILVLQSLY